jgi:hypothetical protein
MSLNRTNAPAYLNNIGRRTGGMGLTVNNRHLWIAGRTGSITVSNANTILEFDPVQGWTTTNMTLKSASSFPVVLPYNLFN